MNRPRPAARLASWAIKPSEADRTAGFELAVSARRFSRRTQAVLDDKLSFSATLMRAGEVEAAQRLLAEVEEEVLTEEAALIELVNEVKVSRSMDRTRITRGRLARTLAVAMMSSSLLAFSVAGAAVVGLFKDDKAIHGADPDRAGGRSLAEVGDGHRRTRDVRVLDNVSLKMTTSQYRRFTKLTAGAIDEMDQHELELFLLELLPPALAERVHLALVAGLEALPAPIAEELVAASQRTEQEREAASQPSDGSAGEPQPSGSAEPEPSPEPSDPEPSDEQTPSPEESPEDENQLPIIGEDEGEG